MTNEPALTRTVFWLMIFTGGVQGALIYLIDKYEAHLELTSGHPLSLEALFTSLAASVTLIFCLKALHQRVFWQSMAALVVVVCGMSIWVSGMVKASAFGGDIKLFYSLSLVAMLLLFMPWLQVRLNSGKSWYDYAMLVDYHWHNALILLLCLLSGGVFWLVLFLWAELFRLLDITFFATLFFDSHWFAFIASGVVFALTVALGRSQPRILQAVQSLFTMIATVLLPLLALIVLLFLITLPFVGLNTISRHISSAGLLTSLTILLLLLTVLVWDPARGQLPYPALLRKLVCLALVVSPLYVAAAGWSIWLRIHQYGWTEQRVYATLIAAVTMIWALGYAWIVLSRNVDAMTLQGRVNSSVLLLALLALILIHTPILGQQRLRALAGDLPLAKKERLTVAALQQAIPLASPTVQPDEAFWTMLVSQARYVVSTCIQEKMACMLVAQDLNQDAKPEWLLWQLRTKSVSVFGMQNGTWQQIGAITDLPGSLDAASLRAAIEQAKMGTAPKPWRDLTLGDERLRVHYWGNE